MNSKHWTRVNRALLSSLEVKASGLLEGLTYIFRVCAENLAGPGPFSEPTDRIVAMDAIRKSPRRGISGHTQLTPFWIVECSYL